MSLTATDLIIAALRKVVNDYMFATERHQEPLRSSEENQAVINRCQPQLELLIGFVKEMTMSEFKRSQVKEFLSNCC